MLLSAIAHFVRSEIASRQLRRLARGQVCEVDLSPVSSSLMSSRGKCVAFSEGPTWLTHRLRVPTQSCLSGTGLAVGWTRPQCFKTLGTGPKLSLQTRPRKRPASFGVFHRAGSTNSHALWETCPLKEVGRPLCPRKRKNRFGGAVLRQNRLRAWSCTPYCACML